MNNKIVDMLGVVQAKIAELAKEEKVLKDALKGYGTGAYEGDLFRATVSTFPRENFDAKEAKKKLLLEGFHAFVKKHTSYTTVTKINVVAKNGEQIAA